jgi:hypothetical protein
MKRKPRQAPKKRDLVLAVICTNDTGARKTKELRKLLPEVVVG